MQCGQVAHTADKSCFADRIFANDQFGDTCNNVWEQLVPYLVADTVGAVSGFRGIAAESRPHGIADAVDSVAGHCVP